MSRRPWVVAVLLSTSCGSVKWDARYTPEDSGGAACAADRDCDDGVYCNGDEACLPADPRANRRGCVRPLPYRSCSSGTSCVEAEKACLSPDCVNDADGDGHRAVACGGDDCDDHDATRYPGNLEVCDAAGHDEDCDPLTLGPDKDGDGFSATTCCNTQPSGAKVCGTDCDDTAAVINPTSPEVCDGRDNNCDGVVDNGVDVLLYPDLDHDGFGAGVGHRGCPGELGFSELNNDCDDANPAIFPGQLRCESSGTLGAGVLICGSDAGVSTKASCGAQQVCHPQPNGTGVCF